MMTRFSTTKLIALSAGLTLAPAIATADEITLTSSDQSVVLRGEFVGFSNQAYIIIYDGQELFVPVHMVTCEGPDCLNFQPAEASSDS